MIDDELINKVTWKIPNALALVGSRSGDERNAIAHKGEHLHTRLRTGLAHGRILLASGQRRLAAYVLQDVERRARAAAN